MSKTPHCFESLPAEHYYDADRYQRELESIWYREWLCLGRVQEWAESGDYRLFELDDQAFFVTRAEDGRLRAFHNTCRHRGSILCEQAEGRFRKGRIVCPYHAWSYSLEGRLEATPRRQPSDDFRSGDHSLFEIPLETWRGFVFVNLEGGAETRLQTAVAAEGGDLDHWPLEELVLAHRESHLLRCNWKIFWENYQECYHCPRIHPDLCRLVPVYREGINVPPDVSPNVSPVAAAHGGPLRKGAVTWSPDGQTDLPWFEGLDEQEKTAGMTFCDILPSMFLVAHVDYVRSVRVVPRGPEQTELIVDWMLLPETLEKHAPDLERLTSFARQVVTEDARACELNQRGLRSRRYRQGVLVPQEEPVFAFDQWVRERMQR